MDEESPLLERRSCLSKVEIDVLSLVITMLYVEACSLVGTSVPSILLGTPFAYMAAFAALSGRSKWLIGIAAVAACVCLLLGRF
jgi:hypothetical protein